MTITVEVNDELLATATLLTGLTDHSDLMNMGLRALVEREAARRLARLGGTEPGLKKIPRRRSALPRKVAKRS